MLAHPGHGQLPYFIHKPQVMLQIFSTVVYLSFKVFNLFSLIRLFIFVLFVALPVATPAHLARVLPALHPAPISFGKSGIHLQE